MLYVRPEEPAADFVGILRRVVVNSLKEGVALIESMSCWRVEFVGSLNPILAIGACRLFQRVERRACGTPVQVCC